MGTCKSKANAKQITIPQTVKPHNNDFQWKSKPNSDMQHFVPLFTTNTLTAVYGFTRIIFKNNNHPVPTDLIDVIYKYLKNNCAFIIIFENTEDPKNSYLHEIDIESGTNINLSQKYNHSDHIWDRVPGASYCYGEHQDKFTIFRIGGENEDLHMSMGCILKTGQTFNMPHIGKKYCQSIYTNHGLYVIGGVRSGQLSSELLSINLSTKSIDKVLAPMINPRAAHLSVFYNSHHATISNRIYCFGGRSYFSNSYNYNMYDSGNLKAEYYDFRNKHWHSIKNMNKPRRECGGCIDNETEKLVICGGVGAVKSVEEYDFERDHWYNLGHYTNYPHTWYPKVTKHNNVVVVFGNHGYMKGRKDYGYVEYFDQRTKDQWIVLSSFRELLEFTGTQCKLGFYQQMLQL